jgi:hypothetical protein
MCICWPRWLSITNGAGRERKPFASDSSSKRPEALRIRQQLEETATMKYVSPCALAIAAIGCGDVEQTYEWLNKGVDEHDPMIITMSQKAPFPGHEQDARFQALRHRMNLDPIQNFPQR